MALNPALRKMIDDAKARYQHPDTFIPSERFHELIDALKAINEPEGEARDKVIQNTLVEIGKIAPESWRELYNK